MSASDKISIWCNLVRAAKTEIQENTFKSVVSNTCRTSNTFVEFGEDLQRDLKSDWLNFAAWARIWSCLVNERCSGAQPYSWAQRNYRTPPYSLAPLSSKAPSYSYCLSIAYRMPMPYDWLSMDCLLTSPPGAGPPEEGPAHGGKNVNRQSIGNQSQGIGNR